MAKEIIKVNGEPQEVEVRPITLLCHNGMANIEVEGRVVINPVSTLECVGMLTKEQWQTLAQAEAFKELFKTVFPDLDMPADITREGMGVKHVVGLILMIRYAALIGKQPFIQMPESYLHPKYQSNLANLFIKISGVRHESE